LTFVKPEPVEADDHLVDGPKPSSLMAEGLELGDGDIPCDAGSKKTGSKKTGTAKT
jgi:hypothetical protein